MENIKNELIGLLTKEIEEIFSESSDRKLVESTKEDNSIVTEIDLLVSAFFKNKFAMNANFKNFNFYSEEDFGHLKFPSIVLDPIDGTREFAIGRAECAVSLAIMNSSELSDPKNYAWLYNPFSGFSLDTNSKFVYAKNFSTKHMFGMVSRSEHFKGLYNNINNPKIHLTPRGSIAFKLGLLSSGACDFVVSKYPKNIWDIAAGTILAYQRGYSFFIDGKKVTKLEQEKYAGVLLWCREECIEELMSVFQN